MATIKIETGHGVDGYDRSVEMLRLSLGRTFAKNVESRLNGKRNIIRTGRKEKAWEKISTDPHTFFGQLVGRLIKGYHFLNRY